MTKILEESKALAFVVLQMLLVALVALEVKMGLWPVEVELLVLRHHKKHRLLLVESWAPRLLWPQLRLSPSCSLLHHDRACCKSCTRGGKGSLHRGTDMQVDQPVVPSGTPCSTCAAT